MPYIAIPKGRKFDTKKAGFTRPASIFSDIQLSNSRLVDKTPIDGLCGKTDEDNLGFTYAALDKYIREGVMDDEETKAKIDSMHERNLFKLQMMPMFKPSEV